MLGQHGLFAHAWLSCQLLYCGISWDTHLHGVDWPKLRYHNHITYMEHMCSLSTCLAHDVFNSSLVMPSQRICTSRTT
jgi:hypothetical protein